MINFLHTYLPDPIMLDFGLIEIHWYGFFIVLGGLLGTLALYYLVEKYKLDKKYLSDLIFYFIISALVGARLYYVIYAWEFYRTNLGEVFMVWHGGLAIHGAIIGGLVALYFFIRKNKQNFWLWSDIIVVGLLIGQIFGRWGNYFNQEIFGRPTDLSWGIPISLINRPIGFTDFNYFHPTFLYEIIGNIFILSILIFCHWLSLKGKIRLPHGLVVAIYLFTYSCLRFGLEFLRLNYLAIFCYNI